MDTGYWFACAISYIVKQQTLAQVPCQKEVFIKWKNVFWIVSDQQWAETKLCFMVEFIISAITG